MRALVPVPVEPTILDTYVGRYKWQPPFSDTFEVDRDGGQLFIWGNERRREPLIAQSETTFVHPVIWMKARFVRDYQGRVQAGAPEDEEEGTFQAIRL